VVSLLYLLFRRGLAVAALRLRSREFKEVEIVVLRHEPAVLRRGTEDHPSAYTQMRHPHRGSEATTARADRQARMFAGDDKVSHFRQIATATHFDTSRASAAGLTITGRSSA
jgi:hypothetical protein